MRMFQTVSGHNSIAAQMRLRYYIRKPIWESPTTEEKNFHRHLRSFHSKLESNGLWVESNHKFSEAIFSTPAIFISTSKLSSSQGCSDDKSWLEFFSILCTICKFRSSILLSLYVSFHFTRRDARVLSSQVSQWRDFPGYFRVRQSGQRQGKGRLSRYVEIFWNKKFFVILWNK